MTLDASKKTVAPTDSEPNAESGEPIESLLTTAVGNWKELLAGLLLAALIVGAFAWYRHKAANAREQAFSQLAVAGSESQLAEIVRQFPSTEAAVLASFMKARAQYDNGLYADADQSYADFLKRHRQHFLAPAARLGRAHCQEANGLTDEALAAYRQFAAEHSEQKAFGLLARLGEARCLRQSGKLADAVALYENLLLEYPDSEWRAFVEDQKQATQRDRARLEQPLASLAAQAPATAPDAGTAPAATNAP